jgi:hypothetical protein
MAWPVCMVFGPGPDGPPRNDTRVFQQPVSRLPHLTPPLSRRSGRPVTRACRLASCLPKLLLFEHGRADALPQAAGIPGQPRRHQPRQIIADWIIAARRIINLSKWYVMVARAVRLTRRRAQRLSWCGGAVVAICGAASVPALTQGFYAASARVFAADLLQMQRRAKLAAIQGCVACLSPSPPRPALPALSQTPKA